MCNVRKYVHVLLMYGTYHVCPSIASVTAGSCYFRSVLLLLGSVFITPSSAAYRKCGWGGKLRVSKM